MVDCQTSKVKKIVLFGINFKENKLDKLHFIIKSLLDRKSTVFDIKVHHIYAKLDCWLYIYGFVLASRKRGVKAPALTTTFSIILKIFSRK